MQTASARQLPGCSTTGRSHAHAQRLNYSHTVLRQLKSRAFGSSSFSSTCKDLKRCLPAKRRQACAVQTRAESTPNQEEAQLRADYGALSQRLEVNSFGLAWLGLPVLALLVCLARYSAWATMGVLLCSHNLLTHSFIEQRGRLLVCVNAPHGVPPILIHELLLCGSLQF